MDHRSERHKINGIELCIHHFMDADVLPSGTTVLLLHGYLDAGRSWDLVAKGLTAQGHYVVAPDLRGYGESGWVGSGGYYHFPDYIADVALLVDALSPERLALVGHSMGGSIACYYAGAFPKGIAKLALLEGTGPPAAEAGQAVYRAKAWVEELRGISRVQRPLSSMDAAIERLAAHHPQVPKEVLQSRARHLTTSSAEGHLVWAYDPLHRTTAPMAFWVDSFHAFLERIEAPTLCIGGGPTGYHTSDEQQRIGHIKNVRNVEIAGAGHMMHWTFPDRVASVLNEFIGEI